MAEATQNTTGPQLTDAQSAELNGWIAEMDAEQRPEEEVQRVIQSYLDEFGTSEETQEEEEKSGALEGPRENPVGFNIEEPEAEAAETANPLVDDLKEAPITADFDYFNDKDYSHLEAAADNFTTISNGRELTLKQSGYGTHNKETDKIIRSNYESQDISDFIDHDEVNQNGIINPKTGKQYTLEQLGEIKDFLAENDLDKNKIIEDSTARYDEFTSDLPLSVVYPEEQATFDNLENIPEVLQERFTSKERIDQYSKAGSYSAEDLEEKGETGLPKVIETDTKALMDKLIYEDDVVNNVIYPEIRQQLKPQLDEVSDRLLKEHGLDSRSKVANASAEEIRAFETAYRQEANELVNEGVNNHPEFIKRRRVFADMAWGYLDEQRNALGIEKSEIPVHLRALGVHGEDMWNSWVSLKGSVEGAGALAAGLAIVDNSKKIARLEKLDPNDALPPQYYDGIKAPTETVGELVGLLKDANKKQSAFHVEKLTNKANLDEFQQFFYQPKFLDGDVTMRDVTSSAFKQVTNMAVSIVPVLGPLALEGGHIYTDTLFAGASSYYDLPEGQEPSREQVTAYLGTPEGETAVNIALGTILGSATLETLGNVAQLKAVFGSKAGKKVMGNLLKGNFKKALKSTKQWGKDQLLGVLGETLTELGQETTQQGSQVLASGNNRYWDVGALKETVASTIVSTSILQGGGSATANAVNRLMNGATPDQRQQNETALLKKVDLDLKKGKITPEVAEEAKQVAVDYAAAHSIIPEDVPSDNRAAAADLVVEKFELERAIEGKDEGAVKTKKEKIKLINEQLDAIINDRAIPTSLEKSAEGNIPTKPSISDQRKAADEKKAADKALKNIPKEESQEIADLEKQKTETTDPATKEELDGQIQSIKDDVIQDGADTTTRTEQKTEKIDKAIDEAGPDKTIDTIDSWIVAIDKDKKRFGGIAPIGIDPKAFHTAGILALKATKAAIKAGRSVRDGLVAGYKNVKDMMTFDEFKATVADELGFYDTTAEQNAVINTGLEAFNNSSKFTTQAIKESYQAVKGVFSLKEWNNYIHNKVFGVVPTSKFGRADVGAIKPATEGELQAVEDLVYRGGKPGGLDVKIAPTAQDTAKRKSLREELKTFTDDIAARNTINIRPIFKAIENLDGSLTTLPTDEKTGSIIKYSHLTGYSNDEVKKLKSILKRYDALHPSAFQAKSTQTAKKALKGLFKDVNLAFDESKSLKELLAELSEERPLLHSVKARSKTRATYTELALPVQADLFLGLKAAEEAKLRKEKGEALGYGDGLDSSLVWSDQTAPPPKLLSTEKESRGELQSVDLVSIKPKPAALTANVANNAIKEDFGKFIYLANNLTALRQAFQSADKIYQNYPNAGLVDQLKPLTTLNKQLPAAREKVKEARFLLKNATAHNSKILADYQTSFNKADAALKKLEAGIRAQMEILQNNSELVELSKQDNKPFSSPIKEHNSLDWFLHNKIIPKLIYDKDGSLKPRRDGTADIPGVVSGIDFRVRDKNGDLVLHTEGEFYTSDKRKISLKGKPVIDAAVFKDWIQRSIKFGQIAKNGIPSGKPFTQFFVAAIEGPQAVAAKAAFDKYQETRKKLSDNGLTSEHIPSQWVAIPDPEALDLANRKLRANNMAPLQSNADLKFELDSEFRNGKISGNEVKRIIVAHIPTKDLLTAEFDIRSTKSKEAIRDFKLGYKVGGGTKLARLVEGSKDLTPGKKSLINPVVLNELTATLPTQIYKALLDLKILQRDLLLETAEDRAIERSKAIEYQADVRTGQDNQKKLVKSIKDKGTKKSTQAANLQKLLDFEVAYPELVTETLYGNGTTALQLAKKFNVTLSPPSKDAYEVNSGALGRLRVELENRYDAKDPIQILDKDGKLQAVLTRNEALYELDMAFNRVKDAYSFESAMFSNAESAAVQIARRSKGFNLPGWNEQIEANTARLNGNIKEANKMDKMAANKAAAGITGGFTEGESSWTAMDQGELNITLAASELSERYEVRKAFREVTGKDWVTSKENHKIGGLLVHYEKALVQKVKENAMIATLDKMNSNKPTNKCNK